MSTATGQSSSKVLEWCLARNKRGGGKRSKQEGKEGRKVRREEGEGTSHEKGEGKWERMGKVRKKNKEPGAEAEKSRDV
jgi:hypothetical protein